MADLSSLLGAAGVGGAIGQAIVRLELDSSKYLAEMKAAEGQTVAGTNAMGASTSKFAGLAQTAFLGAGVAAVAFGAYAVKSAIDAADAQLKLQNTFENNARLSDSSVEAFTRQANALRDLTGVDDEAIISAQALLGQFKLTGDQVQQLIPRIVDLSAKMGIDLEAAAKAVGKATQGSAGILSRYGIILDADALKADAFGTTLKGLGVAAGFAADRAKNEPWRLLGQSIEELAESVGTNLLPALRGIVEWVTTEGVPALGVLLDAIVAIFDPKTYTDIPIIGEAFKALGAGISAVEDAAVTSNDEIRRNGLPLLSEQKQLADIAAAGFISLSETFPVVADKAKMAAESVHKLSKAGKEIADGIRSELPDIIGTVTRVKDAFDISPKELQAIAHHWATIGEMMADDLREIANSDLKPAMRQAIASLPPEMRHAWAEGNAQQKKAIEASLRDAYDMENVINGLARRALTGGQEIGQAMGEGMIRGVQNKTAGIAAQAEAAVLRAMAAARRAAQAESPSKKMMELGVDMMIGLADGINDAEQRAIDAARTAIEKSISSVEDALSKIQSKASSFRDSIKGAFGSFLDLSGAAGLGTSGEITGFAQTQAAWAGQLADVLRALKTQGASKGLLSQVAGMGGMEAISFGQTLLQGGPAAIEDINSSLKTISDLASQTGKALSERFFGDKIDKIEAKLDRLHDDLRELNALEREGHSHDIVVDGQKLAETTRRELLKTGARNSDIFGGKA